ncbi:hypothetical protein KIPB_006935 [Kipferlia bialata]|uniref:Uncharacterized protein n=1 Tax=Kipferlia bialata TaxID=797122 RepID=A0A9K3D110_9EUKA|nr:hypothetical protein KIPB_006935 [Kipferlia bialata]|eukprot:g6935.t1
MRGLPMHKKRMDKYNKTIKTIRKACRERGGSMPVRNKEEKQAVKDSHALIRTGVRGSDPRVMTILAKSGLLRSHLKYGIETATRLLEESKEVKRSQAESKGVKGRQREAKGGQSSQDD